jgi:hypothetical protein
MTVTMSDAMHARLRQQIEQVLADAKFKLHAIAVPTAANPIPDQTITQDVKIVSTADGTRAFKLTITLHELSSAEKSALVAGDTAGYEWTGH